MKKNKYICSMGTFCYSTRTVLQRPQILTVSYSAKIGCVPCLKSITHFPHNKLLIICSISPDRLLEARA